MFLVLTSLQSVLAPCCWWLGASDGHESSSTRLAWPSVATRNGLAPSHTNRRAQDLQFFCHSQLSVSRFATHSHARSNACRLVPVQVSQQPVPQINLVLAFSHFQQPDLLTTEGLADKSQAPLPPDLAVAADPPPRPMSRIKPAWFGSPIRSLGTPIQTLRYYLSQGFVRPLLIELPHPAIKTLLLCCRAVR